MPTLNWIGKEAVVNHHLQVPFRLLKDVPALSCGDPGSGNLIVQGDNLVALKALLPYYAGQVKCVCIDPPYNTGNEVRRLPAGARPARGRAHHRAADTLRDQGVMKPSIDPEDLVRRFNEDEAAWRNYGRKLELRHMLRPDSPLPEEVLDYLDWLEAERECREIPCIGRVIR